MNTTSITFGYYRDNGVVEVEHTLAEYHGMLYIEEFRERVEEEEEEILHMGEHCDDDEDGDSILSLSSHEKDEFEEFVQSNPTTFSCYSVLGFDLEGEEDQYMYSEDIRLLRSEDEESLSCEPAEPIGRKFSSREYRQTEVRGETTDEAALPNNNVELVHLEQSQYEDIVVQEKLSLSCDSTMGGEIEEEESHHDDESTIGPIHHNDNREQVSLEPAGIKLCSGSDRAEVQGYAIEKAQDICRDIESLEIVHLEPLPTVYDDEFGSVAKEATFVPPTSDDEYFEEYVAEKEAKDDDEF